MKFPGRLRVVIAGTAVMAAGLGAGNYAAAAEQMIGFGKETFQLNLGYYRPNFTTSVSESAPGSIVPPGNISGEDDLGLDKSLGVGRVDGYWRFADKHRLFLVITTLTAARRQP